jgi:hypothetical protein
MGINRRGSISIEALLSILLLMVVISVTWGLSVFIYNASMLSTATQLGAQAGLLSFDRGSYRGGATPISFYRAQVVAGNVFRENTCGMLPDQVSGQRPDTGCGEPGDLPVANNKFSVEFLCAPGVQLSGGNALYLADNCQSPERSSAVQAQAISGSAIRLPFSYLTGDSNNPQSTTSSGFRTSSSAYSFVWEEPE